MIFDTLAQELARAEHARTPLAIVMADIDRFKSINDSFGHPVGDAVLRQASRRLSACVRSYDHLGRYGGEEFLIVMPNCNREQAIKVSERLRQSVADSSMIAEGKELNITCSLGVAFTDTSNGTSVAVLVQTADEALYLRSRLGAIASKSRRSRRLYRPTSKGKPGPLFGLHESSPAWFGRLWSCGGADAGGSNRGS